MISSNSWERGSLQLLIVVDDVAGGDGLEKGNLMSDDWTDASRNHVKSSRLRLLVKLKLVGTSVITLVFWEG
jgi:hypothetical protein